ncbi:MAG: 3-methyl-2-oxobutanoate hydroxymethyltransferase, partial [Gammaproteobacteria bacterium]|nr:3-methyl-2-oxobutanoate hydroxymethyltransferase [Gammaproteobacteria bacterium]
AHAVKLEGGAAVVPAVTRIIEAGIPVMGHLGLTPQSVEALGGHRVQGRSEGAAVVMLASARRLEAAGCFSLVLECVPSALARTIAEALSIPVIGIGAGVDTDGQVLVLHDMLGMNETFKPRFLRHYATTHTLVREAANHFHVDVQERAFPAREESYA